MLWDELPQNSPGLQDNETQAGLAAARMELLCTIIHQNQGFNGTKRSCEFRFQSFGCESVSTALLDVSKVKCIISEELEYFIRQP